MVHVYENDGKRSTARNHSCPASLLSVDGKIFEKLPNNRFVNHIKKSGLFSKFHYGFRSSQSIAGLLPDASNTTGRAFNRFGAAQPIALDISKNFGSLPQKLKSNGTFCKNTQLIRELIKGPLLGLIFSDYILMTVLMMLSLILLLSMLIILLCTLSVIGYKIFGNK